MKKMFSILVLLVVSFMLTGCEALNFLLITTVGSSTDSGETTIVEGKTTNKTQDDYENTTIEYVTTFDEETDHPLTTTHEKIVITIYPHINDEGNDFIRVVVPAGTMMSDILLDNDFSERLSSNKKTFMYWSLNGEPIMDINNKKVIFDSTIEAVWSEEVKPNQVIAHFNLHNGSYEFWIPLHSTLGDVLSTNNLDFIIQNKFLDVEYTGAMINGVMYNLDDMNSFEFDNSFGFYFVEFTYNINPNIQYLRDNLVIDEEKRSFLDQFIKIPANDKKYIHSMTIDTNAEYFEFLISGSHKISLDDIYILANGNTYRFNPMCIFDYYNSFDGNMGNMEYDGIMYDIYKTSFNFSLKMMGLNNYSGTISLCVESNDKELMLFDSYLNLYTNLKSLKVYNDPFNSDAFEFIRYYNDEIRFMPNVEWYELFNVTGYETSDKRYAKNIYDLFPYLDQIEYIKVLFEEKFKEYNELFMYRINENKNGYVIARNYKNDAINSIVDLVIPSEINGDYGLLPVKEIQSNSFYDLHSIESVTIPGSVIVFNSLSFRNCFNLHTIYIEEGVQRISNGAVEQCFNIDKVEIPSSVSFIEQHAFGWEGNVNSYNFNKTIEETIKFLPFIYSGFHIYVNCLDGNLDIDDIDKYVEFDIESTFGQYVVSKKANVDIPEIIVLPIEYQGIPISTIGNFANSSNLKYFVIADNIMEIEESAFLNCTNLELFAFNSSGYTLIKDNAFGSCNSLNKIFFYGSSFIFESIKAINEYFNQSGLNNNCEYIILDYYNPVFEGDNLDYLRFIYDEGYEGYIVLRNDYFTSYKNIEIPESFDGPNGLHNVVVINNYCFRWNRLVETIILPSTIKIIEGDAFSYCENLKRIYLPKSITYLDNCLFINSNNLRKIYYEGSKEEWNRLIRNKDLALVFGAQIVFNSSPNDIVNYDSIDYDLRNGLYPLQEETYTLNMNETGLIMDVNKGEYGVWDCCINRLYFSLDNIKTVNFKCTVSSEDMSFILKIEGDGRQFEVVVRPSGNAIDYTWDLTQYENFYDYFKDEFKFVIFAFPGELNKTGRAIITQLELSEEPVNS